MTKQALKNLIFPLLFCSLVSYSQSPEVQSTLETIINHAESNSLYREDVAWDSLKAQMYELTKHAKSIEDLKPALELMLRELNDTHGRIFHNNRYLAYYTGDKREHRSNMDPETYNQIQSGQAYPFRTMILDEGIGYVRIVGLPMGDNEKMSSEIQNAVCQLIEQGATKWIIDLRYNGGGNMFPMVEGITNIIGDGIVGGTKGVTENESSIWAIRAGDFYYDEQTVALANSCPIKEEQRIAVLTSIYTASSGEALAVILKNRPGTRFFGGKTLGMITATDWKPIDSLTAMSISVSYYKDRNDNIYDEYVDVDEMIPFDPKAPTEEDRGIVRAIDWLNKKQ